MTTSFMISEVEREFAQKLDQRDDVRLFVKLPEWFKVELLSAPTIPIGPSSNIMTKRSTCARNQRHQRLPKASYR